MSIQSSTTLLIKKSINQSTTTIRLSFLKAFNYSSIIDFKIINNVFNIVAINNSIITREISIKKTIYSTFIESIIIFNFDATIQIIIDAIIDIEINKILQRVIQTFEIHNNNFDRRAFVDFSNFSNFANSIKIDNNNNIFR